MDAKEQKREARKKARAAKPTLRNDDYVAAGRRLSEVLTKRADIANAVDIVAYWPLPDELNTGPFITDCVKAGKRIFLPVIVGKDLVFREYTGYKCLRREESFGILEPYGTPVLDLSRMGDGVIAIVPGLAFTPKGDRLGRGRGFYDRALSQIEKAKRIGVCYECQMTDELPTEDHDLTMDDVVSIGTNDPQLNPPQ